MKFLKSLIQPLPMSWCPAERLLMRLAFAGVILFYGIIWNAAQLPDPAVALKVPNGLAKVLPLQWLAGPAVLAAGKPLVALGLLLYVLGRVPVLALLPALLFMLGTGSLRNSMGDISHHTQIVAMVLLVQWLAYLIGVLRHRSWMKPPPALQDQVIFWSVLMIGASYFASGLVKLKASDLEWIQRVPSLSVQVFKAVWSESYSSGVPVSGFKAETVPWLIVQHPHLARLVFGTGLLLELLGLFMVLSQRHARWIGIGLIAMHLGISALMEIDFVNHILLVLIFAVNPMGWVVRPKTTGPAGMEQWAGPRSDPKKGQ